MDNKSNNKLNNDNGNNKGQDKEQGKERDDSKKQIQEIGYIKPREIVEEMKDSYIDYAMSVIVARALPDVRDGLKPVHRRILYTMMEEGLRHNVKFRKSATVVGSTLGRYHPHGDMAVYDSLVRMAQDFSLRYPLVQGQGNFGCFTKNTKVKLTDGRSLNFAELIKEQKQGKKHWTFSFNSETKKVEITEVKNPRLTRKNEKIMEVELDNGEKIKCTLDHRFMTRDGNYEQAKNLKPRSSLMPLYSDIYKVVATKTLKRREDVYDLTTEPCHNFLLDAGVFVHNSIDADPAAASRYTEARMSKIGEEMLKNIEKETVNFRDNYDATRKEPIVLPSPVPQLLLNGTLGIAVGMATSIPPHNLSEVIDATIHLIDNPKADTRELFKFIKGPDYPGGGMIYNQKDIIEAYSVGKGPIEARGKAEIIEDKKGRDSIIITEIPYQVQKSGLVQQFAKLVQEKKITGVKTVRDESDREGMRIVIEMSKDAFPQKILNRLYKFSDLQKTFHLNMLALVDGIQPKVLSLSEVLTYFNEHKKQVVIRRTEYDLRKAQERAHILEGLHKCLSKIDEVIKTIKASKNREDAQKNLMKKFKLTEIQANAILEMKLANLAKLERQRIEDELKEKQKMIKEFKDLLASPKKIKDLMKKELQEMKEVFGDERRTKVFAQKIGEIAEEDLIPQEETIITLTLGGYIKRVNPDIYKIQRRGGKGIMGMKTLGEDVIEHFISCETHDSLLFFTDSGRVFKVPAYEIPEGTRVAKGRGILNFLEITPQEKILSIFSIGKQDEELGIKYLVMATKNGIIKRTELSDFKNVRRSGLIAITLKKNDSLQSVCKSAGKDEIILITKQGQSIRFQEQDVRPMSRTAAGNMGIRLKKLDELKGMDVIKPKTENYLLVLTENGYGKRTNLQEYRLQGRGGSGIKTANITDKTGGIASTKILTGKEEDLIVISQKGQVIRTSINTIAKLGRPTQGVKIMRLDKGDKVASAACM